MAGDQNLFVQFRSINLMDSRADIENEFLQHKMPLAGVYFDYNCKNSRLLLKALSEQNLFNHHYHWLIFDNLADKQGFYELFRNFQMAVDADLTYIYPKQDFLHAPSWNTSFRSYDVYNNGYMLGGKLNMTADKEINCNRNGCHLYKYLSLLYAKSKYENRIVLEDITMRVSTVVSQLNLTEPPEKLQAHLRTRRDIHIDGLVKFCFQYLIILQDALKCNYYYNYTNTWSITEINGGCIGAIGIEHSADLASSSFVYSKPRSPYVRPTMIVGNFRQVCLFRTPRNSGMQSLVFLEPFSTKVWWIFCGLLVIFAILLWLAFFVEFHTLKLYLYCVPSLLTTCLISFGSACCQSCHLIPKTMGGRIIFFTLSLLTFIIYNYYTSIVVSTLLGSPIKSKIKTMSQLADSSLEVGLEPIGYTRSYLNFTQLPEIKRFRKNKIESHRNPSDVWIPVAKGIPRVRQQPGFVYVIEAISGYDLIQKMFTSEEICDLNEILFRPKVPLYFHLPKNSSYREIVKLKQIRILETGIYRHHYRYWIKDSLTCVLSSTALVQVGLEYTAPLFIMLASSYVLVLILILIEIMWRRYLEPKK